MLQVDDHVNRHLLIDEIEDQRTTKEAISLAHGTYKTQYGFDRNKKTAKVWEFYVKREDRSRDWVSMKDLKDSYPAQLEN